MILSKKFVNDYIKVDEDIKDVAEEMTRVGNEYDVAKKLVNINNLVIGEVLECDNVEGSNHLHKCQINVGNETLQIVCGAPNMRKGLKVIVALPGAILPGGTIKKSTILGVESNGMCCSLEELGIDKKFLNEEDIKGIHELPSDAPIGDDPIKYLALDDEIVDFELTANRSDLLSMIGMSYELGAIYDRDVTEPTPKYEEIEDNFENEISLKIDTDKVSAFLLGRVKNIEIKESPNWLRNRLIACNIRPINNVVDISNYIMLETGQPLHFYDADKVGNTLGVRLASEGEILTTLDGKERCLTTNDLVIYTNDGAVGLAGVMGGLSTEIDENTKNVLIESAIFDPVLIRKTSKRILRSEASIRFEKGLDIKRTYLAMERSKELLSSLASGSVSKGLIAYNTIPETETVVEITLSRINSVLGMNLSINDVKDVLKRLKFNTIVNDETFIITVPSRRRDISIKEDIIEEVGRIYGVDNLVPTLPKTIEKKGHIDKFNRDIKVKLSNSGLSEVITYSLINEKDVNKFKTEDFTPVNVKEPMTIEREVLRNSLITSLIEVYNYNKSRGNKDINIFEIGSVFKFENNEYIEENKLSILMSGEFISGINTKTMVDFYYLKGIVENLLDYLGYKGRYDFEVENEIIEMHPYKTASIILNGIKIGFLGMVHPSFSKDDLYVSEINLSKLKAIKCGKIKFKEIPKFPAIKKDVSFIIESDFTSSEIIKEIKKNSSKYLKSVIAYDEFKMPVGRSITFTLTYLDETKTLTEEEVMDSFNEMISKVTEKFNAKLKNM